MFDELGFYKCKVCNRCVYYRISNVKLHDWFTVKCGSCNTVRELQVKMDPNNSGPTGSAG